MKNRFDRISYGYAIVLKTVKVFMMYNKAEINMIKLKKVKRSNIR